MKDLQNGVSDITTVMSHTFMYYISLYCYICYLVRSRRRMCQQFRLVRSITPTRHRKRCCLIFLLCLFTFQQTSDKINEELLVVVSVIVRHNSIQHLASTHFFLLNLFTYYRQVRIEQRRFQL